MRIAIIVSRFPVLSEMFIANTASGMVDLGHEVDIFCLRGAGRPDVLNAAGVSRGLLARTHVPRKPDAGRIARALGLVSASASILRHQGPAALAAAYDVGAHRRRVFQLRTVHELALWNHAPRPDVIHCQFGTLAEPMLRHIRSGALPAALVVHLRGHDLDPFVARRGPGCYREVWDGANAVIANSERFRDKAIGFGCPPEKIHVVESPVDVESFPWRPPQPPQGRPVRLLTVGRLTEKKGIAYVIDATAELRRRGHRIALRIIGGGELRQSLEAHAAALGLGDTVSFLGPQPHTVIAEELASADIFLAPSVRDSQGEEDALNNTLKEAMLSGVPSIGTWHGGIPELITHGETGMLVPERDAIAIADTVEGLLGQPESWLPLARRARASVEQRFEIGHIARQTEAVYNFALDRWGHGQPAAIRPAIPAGAEGGA
jgi:colanic acid/amylovoran biosynthesis glycosyltransferase